MFLFSTPMGTWSGRIGRKPILFLSLAGFIVTNLLLAFLNVPLLFIPIRFVEGMLLSGLISAAMAMVGDTIPLEKQGRWIGFLTTAQAVGFALGPGLGGLLAQTLGLSSPFLLSAAIALAASLLAIFLVPETLPEHLRAQAREHQASRGAKAQKPREARFARLIWLIAPFLVIDFGSPAETSSPGSKSVMEMWSRLHFSSRVRFPSRSPRYLGDAPTNAWGAVHFVALSTRC
jgi:MFS family permease